MARNIVLFALAFFAWSASPHAQLATSDSPTSIKVPGKTEAEYRLGPGDLIEINVFGVASLTQSIRVSASGLIKLPLLDPIEAAGLTSAELERRLTTALEDGDIVKKPQVSVFVKEYRSQPVFVLGAVKTPGQYQVSLQLKIVDVISMAGGLLSNAGDEALIQRKSADGAEQSIKVNLRELLEKSDSSLNIVVQGGDVVHVAERLTDAVYVLGEVNRAGVFPLPPRQDLTVTQVFAAAGGPMKTARMEKGILVRYRDGKREQLPVNFNAILKGKKEDFVVRANDILFVPGSKFKTLGYGALGSLPGSLVNLPFWIIP